MKFTNTFLLLSASLSSTNAFMVQTPKRSMRPLMAETPKKADVRWTDPSVPAPMAAGQAAPMDTQAAHKYSQQLSWVDPTVPSPLAAASFAPAPQTPSLPVMAKYNKPRTSKEIFEDITPVKVQGGSLRTCSFDENVDRISVFLKTTGRPLNSNVELWQGPDNAPQKMTVYLEDGDLRPFRCTIESPGSSNAIAIRNTGQMEFPLTAYLECDMSGPTAPSEVLLDNSESRTVQGGAVYTSPFPPSVASVQIALRSDGRPLNARIELLQGPNNNKQVMEVYTEDGRARPFYAVIDTPGSGNVVRIVNTATVEFPLTASVESYIVEEIVLEDNSSQGGLTWS